MTIIWSLIRSGAQLVFNQSNGTWKIELITKNVTLQASSEDKAKKMGAMALKRYICALIEDLKDVEVLHFGSK
jgi:hypothetical protein